MSSPFDLGFEELPRIIPIFPLSGALLLPQGKLPLNIFEPRYLQMTQDAIAAERVIGMIQPENNEEPPAIFGTGCMGRITSFSETDDGRLLITLSGMCRFNIIEELPLVNGYRRVVADCHRYRNDLSTDHEAEIPRERLLEALRGYLVLKHVDANWEAIEKTDDLNLVTSLAMMCPFEASEKQALLEADAVSDRADIMLTLLEMALLESSDGAGQTRQ
ncbi:MAG: LON peptidase substrate-binding domain-containing protein [Pseudomonadota bacterium]|nr:LON peptidase substrate-binding domain-containing protein [Pseudomonadota bacterium]